MEGQLTEKDDKLQAVENELHNCQQSQNLAAGRDGQHVRPSKFREPQPDPVNHHLAAVLADNQNSPNAGAVDAADDHDGHDAMFRMMQKEREQQQKSLQREQHPKKRGEQKREDLVGDGRLQQQGQDEDRDSDEEEAKVGKKQHNDKEKVALHAPNVEQQEKEHKHSDAL